MRGTSRLRLENGHMGPENVDFPKGGSAATPRPLSPHSRTGCRPLTPLTPPVRCGEGYGTVLAVISRLIQVLKIVFSLT